MSGMDFGSRRLVKVNKERKKRRKAIRVYESFEPIPESPSLCERFCAIICCVSCLCPKGPKPDIKQDLVGNADPVSN